MKYFTVEASMGDQDLETERPPSWDAAGEYEKYLKSVAHLIPVAYNTLYGRVYLHDSNLYRLHVDLPGAEARMVLHGADHDRNACRITITYFGVTAFYSTSDPEKSLAGPGGYGDFGYDEIEVLESGSFEHRMLFSSGVELGFRFTGLSFDVSLLDPSAN